MLTMTRETHPGNECDYRARYYDSWAGRFISEDPLRFDSGVDFYAYVRNRPAMLTDPTGLQEETPPCGELLQPLCDLLSGKKKPAPKPAPLEVCNCVRVSPTPKGLGVACVYSCNCIHRDQAIVSLQSLRNRFPKPCKDLTFCPYSIDLKQSDYISPDRYRVIAVPKVQPYDVPLPFKE
jgi:RHS repeat-associated protein